MNGLETPDRRTVLRTLGAGAAGSIVLSGSALAHDPEQKGQTPVFLTWGDDEIWEMVDAEPPSRDRMQDAEGNDHAHAPLYIISAIPDGSHSPQFGDFDQVVPVPGGEAKRQYSAQWHPKVVVQKDNHGNFENKDQNGDFLTSATRIQNATNVAIFALPEETVFTCPVRPHHENGSNQ